MMPYRGVQPESGQWRARFVIARGSGGEVVEYNLGLHDSERFAALVVDAKAREHGVVRTPARVLLRATLGDSSLSRRLPL